MMPQGIALVYFDGCPHVDEARRRLRSALESVGLPPQWAEWDAAHEETPDGYRRFASPTIVVDGRDVAGSPHSDGMSCAAAGAPSVAAIVGALRAGHR